MHSARVVSCALALACLATPYPTRACEGLRWELRDVLRELLEARLAQGHALAPLQVEAALRRRELPFVAPVFRFAPKASPSLVEGVSNDTLLRPCGALEGGAEAEPTASLLVEAAVESFVATPLAHEWRFVAHAPERAFAARADLLVASSEGATLHRTLRFEGFTARALVPRSALALPAVAQLVATTPRGPEVLAETWLGDAATIAEERRAALSSAPLFAHDTESGLRASLNTQRQRLGLAPLRACAALDHVAKSSMRPWRPGTSCTGRARVSWAIGYAPLGFIGAWRGSSSPAYPRPTRPR